MKLAALARRLLAPLRPTPAPADAGLPDYEAFRRQRLAARRPAAAAPLPPGLLSVITPAWNTDVAYLRSLAESLLPQLAAHGQEWVLLDNGSAVPQTLEVLRTPCAPAAIGNQPRHHPWHATLPGGGARALYRAGRRR